MTKENVLLVTEVLSYLDSVIKQTAVNPGFRLLLQRALTKLRAQSESLFQNKCIAYIHIPLLIYKAISGDERPAIPLAALTSLLYLSFDVFDDLADEDDREKWPEFHRQNLYLVGIILLGALPRLLISQLEITSEQKLAIEYRINQGIFKMAAGQHLEYEIKEANVSSSLMNVKAVEEAAGGKTGAQIEMYAAIAAQMAGATPETIAAYEAYALAFGTAGQLFSDWSELFVDKVCRDLIQGTRTLPLMLHLQKLSAEELQTFVELLKKAQTDQESREEVKQQVDYPSNHMSCAVIIEIYCSIARRALMQANPPTPVLETLGDFINQTSLYQAFGHQQ